MRTFLKKHHHRIFKGSILLKAIIGAGEIVVGLLFILLNQVAIEQLVAFVVPAHLSPSLDVTVRAALRDIFLYSNAFWAFLLLSHGLTKIVLIYGLLRDRRWAYIASLLVFSYFILNQLYNDLLNRSLALELITLFDVSVVFLIFNEYRRHKKRVILEKDG